MKNKKKKISKKENKFTKAFNKVKNFMNKPQPIFIALIAIICILILYIASYNKKDLIVVGSVTSEKIAVERIHLFTNSDMEYFYASPVIFAGDEKIYSYQAGYYVENKDGELVEFATRSDSFDEPTELSGIMMQQGAFEVAETYHNRYIFSDDVMNYLDKLHFVIKASSKKDSTIADVKYDVEVTAIKITK